MAQKTEVIARIPHVDPEAGCEYVVARIDRGYSVAIRDTDADEYLPTVRIFPTLAAALGFVEPNAA